ncbi:MAG: hypothetical protein R3F36_05075 [Candidatus Competibacteraceae bacterium]
MFELERRNLDLPLLIELRAFAQARERDPSTIFLDFLQHGVRWRFVNWTRTDCANCWYRVACGYSSMDWMSFRSVLREEIVNVIQRFANDFTRARIVVTSRVIGYKGESFRSAGFRHFMLQELDDEQIAVFPGQWHRDTYYFTRPPSPMKNTPA